MLHLKDWYPALLLSYGRWFGSFIADHVATTAGAPPATGAPPGAGAPGAPGSGYECLLKAASVGVGHFGEGSSDCGHLSAVLLPCRVLILVQLARSSSGASSVL